MKRDIEIHKQVESELAKRSHFCQKLIKKLSGKIKLLEDEIEETNLEKKEKGKLKRKKDTSKNDKNKNDLITFLEKSLEQSEKKIAKL